jgi:hypothetical protein
MSMALIAVTPQFPMTIIWITCTMGIYIISTTTIGTNALLRDALNMLSTNTNMDRIVVMLQSPMVTTSTIYTTDTFMPPTATTGTNTKYSVSGRGDVR